MKAGKTQLSAGEAYMMALEKAIRDFSRKDLDEVLKVLNTSNLRLNFLGRAYSISHPAGEVKFENLKEEPSSVTKILILHYLTFSDGSRPANTWVTFRQLPWGMAYGRTFRKRAEMRILECYEGSPEELKIAGKRLGGKPGKLGDASIELNPFPLLPMQLVLWAGDKELQGELKILFDERAPRHLPGEDLATLGELIAEELCEVTSI